MSSVRNRILQFQRNEEGSVSPSNSPRGIGPTSSVKNDQPEFYSRGNTPPLHSTDQSVLQSSKPKHRDLYERAGSESAPRTAAGESALIGGESAFSRASDSALIGPPVMSANTPKKATLTINLSAGSTAALPKPVPSPNRPKLLEKPRSPFCPNSSIPKLISPTRSNVNAGKSLENLNNGNNAPVNINGALDWKEKYEEAERKRLHIVTLAQKATRDYEELRRRYQELGTENEKVVQRLKSSNGQLEALRNASEAAYHDYYKLKKHYQVENSAKSQALSRVDEYNKENRKLKRQSAALMQHFTEGGNFDLEQLMGAGGKGDEVNEDDREIRFLRSRVQELESRVVDLESEVERTKLAEFESQEAVMLINDSVQSSANEMESLRDRLRRSDEHKETLESQVHELRFELESLRAKFTLGAEKLQATEAELRKIQAEKNVLQRQSVIFFSNSTLDAQLQDALNQISDIQLQFEEQKLSYETQILHLQDAFHDKESDYEAKLIKDEATVKSLETLVQELRQKVDEAEEKLEKTLEQQNAAPPLQPPPPPPPPPPMNFLAPPPPPMPTGLNSIHSVTLRKAKEFSSTGSLDSSGTSTPEPKSIIPNSSAQIDDVVSQIKKGIKLRSADSRTMSRKETDVGDKPAESVAIEEMRSILNNLKRTRRVN